MALKGISNRILQQIVDKIGSYGAKSTRFFQKEAKSYIEKGIEEQTIDSSIDMDAAIDELNKMITEQNTDEENEENSNKKE